MESKIMRTWIQAIAMVLFTAIGTVVAHAVELTDVTVFSANSEGNNWNGYIWNTQGDDTDMPSPGRWNLYLSSDPLSDLTPTFINGFNDTRTRIDLPLSVGDQTFSVYGNGVGIDFDSQQHFVLNLYFGGVQNMPGISGVQNLGNSSLAAAGHSNGLDIFGNSAQQEAGTLAAVFGNQLVTLTAFSWITDGTRDVVWPHYANDAPYSSGDGALDYYGSFTLNVRNVPEPMTLVLVAIGIAGLAASRLQRQFVT